MALRVPLTRFGGKRKGAVVKVILPFIVLVPILLHAGEGTAGAPAAEQQAPPVARQEIVVTASAAPELVSETPAAVTVIDAEAIERSGARDLADLLRAVPGLTLARSARREGRIALHARGARSTRSCSGTASR
jgi:outer membrane cobalamin receptor